MTTKHHPILYIDGIKNGPTDRLYTLETVDDPVLMTWNVTRIERDAMAGKFGPAGVYSMNGVPKARFDLGNLNRDRIEAIKTDVDLIDKPVIGIGNSVGGVLCICDGNHRLTARQELELPDFTIFIVPVEMEAEYRIFTTTPP